MAKSYPYRQTLAILAVCVLGAGATGAYVIQKNRYVADGSAGISRNNSEEITSSGARSEISTSTDWKSAFFSNLNDGEGSALTGTDGPDGSTGSVGQDSVSETLTDRFGKDFFSRFMILQQNGLTEDEASVQTVVDQSMDDFIEAAPMPTAYAKKDVSILMQSDRSAQRTYANSVGMAFHLYMPKSDAATIATEALETEQPEMLFEVDVITASYKALLKQLLAIPVPEVLATKHVNLVNGVSSMLFVSEGIGKISSDPLQSLVALSIYAQSQGSLSSALLDLANYYQSQSIAFENTEPGVLFMQILY